MSNKTKLPKLNETLKETGSDKEKGPSAVLKTLEISGSLIAKALFIVVLIIFLAAVYHSADANDINLGSLEQDLLKQTDLSSMKECSDRELKEFMGLDANKYEGVIYYKSKKALGVNELLIVKAKTRGAIDSVKDAVQKRIDDQTKAFEGYGPEQIKLLKSAVVYTRGNYLFYCVDDDTDQYEEVFKDAI